MLEVIFNIIISKWGKSGAKLTTNCFNVFKENIDFIMYDC